MKLFSRTPSPLSLDAPLSLSATSPSSPDAPPSPLPLSGPSSTSDASTLNSISSPLTAFSHRKRSSSTTTTNTTTTTSTTTPSPPSPTTTTTTTTRRPRLHHGAPPFYQCWATVRQSSSASRRTCLRYCTVSGPTLRLSATPSGDVLTSSICVYGAAITTDDFPSPRIVIRTAAVKTKSVTKIVLCADSKADHIALAAHLCNASKRSISNDYTFSTHVRDGLFARLCVAHDDASAHAVSVKVVSKALQAQRYVGQLVRREPVILLCLPAHATLAKIRDVYESARAYYIVTDALPQQTLTHAMKYRTFCERDVAVVVSDLLAALLQLRAAGLVHRLICPDTVAVEQDESRVRGVTLTDFEMAIRPKQTMHTPQQHTQPQHANYDGLPPCPSLTALLEEDEGLRRQHAAYIPPEVYAPSSDDGQGHALEDDDADSAGNADSRSSGDAEGDAEGDEEGEREREREESENVAFAHDVWSVGMVMHWMLVGCTPFDEHVDSYDTVRSLVADAHGMPVFSGPLWRGVTPGAKHLCASLLHADARTRLTPSRALQHPWLRS